MRPEDTADLQRQLDEAMAKAEQLRAKLNPPGTQPRTPPQGAGYDAAQARDSQMQQRQAAAGAAMGAPQGRNQAIPAAPSAPPAGGRVAAQGAARPPATMRMAADMGARAGQIDAFTQGLDADRARQQAERQRIQGELRARLLQFAKPHASPVELDMARRGGQPPPTGGY